MKRVALTILLGLVVAGFTVGAVAVSGPFGVFETQTQDGGTNLTGDADAVPSNVSTPYAPTDFNESAARVENPRVVQDASLSRRGGTLREDFNVTFEYDIDGDPNENVSFTLEDSEGTELANRSLGVIGGTHEQYIPEGTAPELVARLEDTNGNVYAEQTYDIGEKRDLAVNVTTDDDRVWAGNSTTVTLTPVNEDDQPITATLQLDTSVQTDASDDTWNVSLDPGESKEITTTVNPSAGDDPFAWFNATFGSASGDERLIVLHDRDGDGFTTYQETVKLPDAHPEQTDLYISIAYKEDGFWLLPHERRNLKRYWQNMSIENPDGTEGVNIHIYEEQEVPMESLDIEKTDNHGYQSSNIDQIGSNANLTVPGDGYKVYVTEIPSERVSGVSTEEGVIIVGQNMRRKSFTITHEVLHEMLGDLEPQRHEDCRNAAHACEGFLNNDAFEPYLPADLEEELVEENDNIRDG